MFPGMRLLHKFYVRKESSIRTQGDNVLDKSEIRIAVFGLGHVGLPTALGLADLGWSVIGADDDLVKAELIARGRVPFSEPGVDILLQRHLDTGKFTVETDTATAIREATVLFLCVGTPKRPDGSADLSMLESVAHQIAPNLNGYKLIVEKSTAPVQTAQQLKGIILDHRESGGVIDFDMAVNPEFLRESTSLHDFFNPDRIVLGVEGKRAEDLLLRIYQPLLDRMGSTIEDTVVITDIDTAEIIKHSSNAFLAAKVSLINMVADLCEATGANVEDVAHAIGMDHRIGPSFLRAGIGYGGSCLPKDIRAFSWIASIHNVDFSLLREVERVNSGRIEYLLSKVRRSVGSVDGKTLAIWGLAFKPGTDDMREAPSLGIIRGLLDEGANLRLHDPQAMDEAMRDVGEDPPRVRYCDSPEEATDGAAAIIILTEWRQYLDVELSPIRDRMEAPRIIDGRNLLDPAVVRGLGFEYHSIGRP